MHNDIEIIKMTKFKRKTVFSPAYDLRSSDPKKNYGIGGVTCTMFLIGEKGVVQFKFSTGFYLPHVKEEFRYNDKINFIYPMGTDIGYHSPVPIYDGQSKMDTCNFYDSGCYYDGSATYAEEFLKLLISEGSTAMWKKMKEYYKETFETENNDKMVNNIGFGQLINAMCKSYEEETVK